VLKFGQSETSWQDAATQLSGMMTQTVLIVDDEPKIVQICRDYLTVAGFTVSSAETGPMGLAAARRDRPDLIVLDTRLGKYDGLDLLQQIRNTYNDLPVILCTAYPTFKRGLKSIAADYYVHKSSNLKELKLRVKMALEGERAFLSKSNRSRVHERESIPTKQIMIEWSNLH